MDNQFDSESYWNSSSGNAFTFDDAFDEDMSTIASPILHESTSEANFQSCSVDVLNFSIKEIIDDKALSQILQEQTLDERIVPKGVAPEEELKLLRRQIQTTLYNPSAISTAQKLLMGKTVSLEVFKSLHEKTALLDAVLDCGCPGDALIAVVLFLKKTLNDDLFVKSLQGRPLALHHYLSYLRQLPGQKNEATALLEKCIGHNDALLLLYEVAMLEKPQDRKLKLTNLNRQCKLPGSNTIPFYAQIIQAHVKLLECLEYYGMTSARPNASPIELLYTSCHKHSNWKEPDMKTANSPYCIAAEQQISSAQFDWTLLNERARCQAYADLAVVFDRIPAWNPIKQKQFQINFNLELAILRLNALKAHSSVLFLFFQQMANHEDKLELARRVKCIKAEVDALSGLKEMTELVKLMESLPERSEEHFYCERALKGLQNKRWSKDNIKIKL